MTQTTGTKKKCDNCGGTGKLNQRKEKACIDYRRSAEDQKDDYYYTYDTCKTCQGKGYLELVWQ